MQVVEQSPSRLVLRQSGWFWLVLLLAVLILLAATPTLVSPVAFGRLNWLPVAVGGAIGLFALGRSVTLIFDRVAGTVEITRQGLVGGGRQLLQLAEVRGAVVQAGRGAGGRGVSRRGALVVQPAGQAPVMVPLAPFFSGGSGQARAVEAINRWLAEPGSVSV